jgi:NDP-sugar pyrophosphorylase family protein
MPIEMGQEYLETRPLRNCSQKVGVCILAAGLATRLEPISRVIAKGAFPLGGRIPIIELWVRKFVAAGISNIAMNLHRVPESIRSYFGDGSRFVADIVYADEQVPSGTLGGAIKMLRALEQKGFHPERVFIPSGDIVSGIGMEHLQEMMAQHTKNGAAVTVMLAPIPSHRRADFGTVILEGTPAGQDVSPGTYARILDFVEKDPDSPSNENNASHYLIETDFLRELERYLTPAESQIEEACYDFGKHVFPGMKGRITHLQSLSRRQHDLYGYEPGTLWFDVGSKRDYLKVNTVVLNDEIDVQVPYTRYPWGWMGEEVAIDLGRVTIKPPVIIGNRCTVLPGAEIGPNVVLGDGWTCHKGAQLKDAVLWPHYNFRGAGDERGLPASATREVRDGVVVDTSIIVGGVIVSDTVGKVVDVSLDGALEIRSIDWVPTGPRI